MKKFLTSMLMILTIVATSMACIFMPVMAEGDSVQSDPGVDFHFLDVNGIEIVPGGAHDPIGSADCILIVDHGVVTMIDTGTEHKSSTDKVVKYVKELGIDKIDHLFLTHPHDDHVGGVPVVCANFDVVNAYYTSPANWKKVRPCEVDWGTKLNYDLAVKAIFEKVNSDGSVINVIHPDEEGKVYKVTDDSYFTVYNCLNVVKNDFREPEFNDFSMYLKYTYKGVNALFTGDVNVQYERTVLGQVKKDGTACSSDDPEAIDPVGICQIYKIPHHGTVGSVSTEKLFNHINPTKDPSFKAVVTGYWANTGSASNCLVASRCAQYGFDMRYTDGTNLEGYFNITNATDKRAGYNWGDTIIHTDGVTTEWVYDTPNYLVRDI